MDTHIKPSSWNAPDTRVRWYKRSQGIVEGYAILWNRPTYGTYHDRPFPALHIKSDFYKVLPDTALLLDHDRAEDVGQVLDRYIKADKVGLRIYAIVRDLRVAAMVSNGLAYFSPGLDPVKRGNKYYGGWIKELSVTTNPGTPKAGRHVYHDEATAQDLDRVENVLKLLIGADYPLPIDMLKSGFDVLQGRYSPHSWMNRLKQHLENVASEPDGFESEPPENVGYEPDDAPLTPDEALGELSAYERLVGPQSGASRDKLRQAGIGA